ncbi:hypothetical protein RD792_012071, partial [Penstemon davidsonii]
ALPSSNFARETENHFDVMDYGATSDGTTDDSQAFLEAWDAACSASTKYPRVVVPPNKTFLLYPVTFHGPCDASKINFMVRNENKISGTIMAPNSASLWDEKDSSQWLVFRNMNGLNVDGFGTVDGRGQSWWDQSCKYHPQLSPGNSPNTDGIHIHSSRHVVITNTQIGCGDDCISIGDRISNIKISNVKCGPGHGISIGSLGKGGNYVQVEKIRVSDTFFNGTSNGARIKTWQVGRGYVRDVKFENIIFNCVKNPIIIDQNYCDVKYACKELESGVKISNVVYKELSGTSATNVAINLNCSKSVPCMRISMDSIRLKSGRFGSEVVANCTSAYGKETNVVPGDCLSR